MKQTLFSKTLFLFVLVTCFGIFKTNAQITETFTDVATLTTTGGWSINNLSSPIGTTTWRQGNSTWATGAFNSFDNANGTNLDYALCDYNSGSSTATLSNWLIGPNITTLSNNDTIRFYTRTITVTGTEYPDNLQVRLSLNGTSVNVGATATSVGDFTTQLLEINPSFAVLTYPQVWTQYQIILSGLPAGNNSGRIAFRYYVTAAGPSGANSFAVGIDQFQFRENVPVSGNTITVGSVTGSPFCPNESISIPFTKTGTFNAGNVFTAQLSDKVGNFATPTTLGTLSSTANGTITGTIPAGIVVGGGYKIRILASNPATTGAASTAEYAANPSMASIVPAGSTVICNGNSVTLNAGPYDRFYGVDFLNTTGNMMGRFNNTTPGTFNTIDTLDGDFYTGDIGTNGELYTIDYNTGRVKRINLGTFVQTVVGIATPAVGHFWIGLGYNSVNSTMYALSTDGVNTNLYTLNQTTAAITLIGSIPTSGLSPIGLAINAAGVAYTIELTNDQLYSINLTTGIPAVVGSLGIDANYAQDLDFDPVTGTLYWAAYNNTALAAELRTINTTTGASTLVGALANGTLSEIGVFAIAGNPTYAWSTGATTSSISVNSANTYTLTVTSAGGCTATASQAVTSGSVTPGITPSNPNVCAGPVTLTATGGGTYLWSTGSTSNTTSVSNAGVVTVTVTSVNGCTASASVTVTSGSVTTPTITPNGPTTFCQGGSVTLTASGGTTYLWSTGASTASINVTSSGTYTVTATTSGCTASNSQAVTVNSIPSVSISGPGTVCSGGSITLTGNGANTYLWSTGSTNSSITVTAGGTYSVTGTSNGCTASGSETIILGTVNAQITPANPNVCAGPTTITASGGGTYLWSTGATTAGITVANAGTYTVTVTGVNTCTASTSVNVTSGTVPTITPNGPTTFCQGGSVTLTAGGGTTYLWSTGASTASINVTSSGTYTVTATSGTCTATQTQTVTVNSVPTVSFTGGTSVCPGGNVQVTANGGTTYIWNTGSTNATITVSSPATYTVTATSNGCTASNSTTISAASGPTATITPNGPTTYCAGQSATQLTASGGTSYIWNTGSTNATITPANSGTYTVTVTDANSCTGSNTQSITINSLPNATIQAGGSTTFCQGGSVMLTASGGATYAWSSGAGSAAITVTSAGTYTVTVTSAAGCTATANQTVNVNAAPNASINVIGNSTFCSNDNPATLQANGGGTYTWNTGAQTSSISPTTSGNYVVTVTDGNNCTATAVQSITVNNAPTATITPSGPTDFCPGGSVTLTATGGATYLWSDATTNAALTVGSSGVYSVTVTSPNGCTATTSQTVNVNANPTTTITPSGATTFCQGGSVTLTAGAGTGYAWSSGGNTNAITVSTSGSYTVTVTIAAGCSATASQLVIVNPLPIASINAQATQVCQGGSVTLTASGGTSFNWSTGANTATININSPGTYTVTVTDANSCTASVPQVISASPSMIVTGNITPAHGSVNDGAIVLSVSGGTSPYSYSWSNGSSTKDISNLIGGTYTVSVTDAQGCNKTEQFTVDIINGINNVESNIDVTVYPNPNTGIFNISAALKQAAPLSIVITDITGKVIFTQTTAKQANYNLPVDLSNMADGIYLVKCFTDAQNVIVKRIAINK
jgi:hypothetical protein